MNDKLESLKGMLETTRDLLNVTQQSIIRTEAELKRTKSELVTLTRAIENLIYSYEKPTFNLRDFASGKITVKCSTMLSSCKFLVYMNNQGILLPNGMSPLNMIGQTESLYACPDGYLRRIFAADSSRIIIDANTIDYSKVLKERLSMKIKNDVDVHTNDFWYDLTLGGYLRPEEMLEEQSDIERVKNAIAVLQEFEKACEEQIEDFYI